MVSMCLLLSFTQELFPSTRFILVLTYWAWRPDRARQGPASVRQNSQAHLVPGGSACPATNDRDQSSRSRLLEKGQLGFRFLRTKQCCIWLVTSTQEPRRCGQSPSRNFRKLQPLHLGPQCHSAPGAQYRARDTNLARKPLATQNLTVSSTYSS